MEPEPQLPTIDTELVGRLVARQFPEWAGLPIRPVSCGGWDNRTFHLGGSMTVRVPSAPRYAAAVEKEQRWLPVLAERLPLPIPAPLGRGAPSADFPLPWSVHSWLDGETALPGRIGDLVQFATDVAGFLNALKRVDPEGGPGPGPHNFHRGGSLRTYDGGTRSAIEALRDVVPEDVVTRMWETALASTWAGDPVWFHGDIAFGNLLLRDGVLAAVIDFGTSGVGDPACDLAIAWTMLAGESRAAFRAAANVDDGTWARGRGWTLWKALIVLADERGTGSPKEAEATRTLEQLLAE